MSAPTPTLAALARLADVGEVQASALEQLAAELEQITSEARVRRDPRATRRALDQLTATAMQLGERIDAWQLELRDALQKLLTDERTDACKDSTPPP